MSHDKLTDRELKVMLAVLRCGADASTTRINDKLETYADERLSLGALHSALDRLSDRKLLTSRMGEATQVRGGKRKKLFAVSGAGNIAVQHAMSVLGKLADGVVEPEIAEPDFGEDLDGEGVLV